MNLELLVVPIAWLSDARTNALARMLRVTVAWHCAEAVARGQHDAKDAWAVGIDDDPLRLSGLALAAGLSMPQADKAMGTLTQLGLVRRRGDGAYGLSLPPQRFEQQQPEPTSERGYVYFAECEESIKVGYSANPWARLKSMQTGSAKEIRLIGCIRGTFELEREILSSLAQHRIKGEWFARCSEVLAEVERRLASENEGSSDGSSYRSSDGTPTRRARRRSDPPTTVAATSQLPKVPAPFSPLEPLLTPTLQISTHSQPAGAREDDWPTISPTAETAALHLRAELKTYGVNERWPVLRSGEKFPFLLRYVRCACELELQMAGDDKTPQQIGEAVWLVLCDWGEMIDAGAPSPFDDRKTLTASDWKCSSCLGPKTYQHARAAVVDWRTRGRRLEPKRVGHYQVTGREQYGSGEQEL